MQVAFMVITPDMRPNKIYINLKSELTVAFPATVHWGNIPVDLRRGVNLKFCEKIRIFALAGT